MAIERTIASLPDVKYGKPGLRILEDIRKNKYIYLMLVPVLAYYLIFHYGPMYGAIIAFKDYSPAEGILGSQWVGLKNFSDFLTGFYFWRVFKNTLLISLYQLIFGFPAPIILALLLNEVRITLFKKVVQTVSYMPHFISLVVVCGIIKEFTAREGVINYIIGLLGGNQTNLLLKPEYFKSIYVISEIWQNVGWNTIIYIAALSAIDTGLYEASKIDGAGRWKQVLHITIPGIKPVVVIMLILQMGYIMGVGTEKILLLYSPLTFDTADVISTYVYRRGILEFSYSFSSAVGLFNSMINFILVISANWISRKVNETSLW
jgi:putative aldouronate transport system permease protein